MDFSIKEIFFDYFISNNGCDRLIQEEEVIVIDLDGTLCEKKAEDEEYIDVEPNKKVLEEVRKYKSQGFYIIIQTSRNMRTYEGNLGLINANTLKDIHTWLENHGVPFDEIHVGRPWCGKKGFYIDDKTIRPDEFLSKSYDEIMSIVNNE